MLFPTYRTCTRVTIKIKTPDTITETQTLESLNKLVCSIKSAAVHLLPSTPFDFACTTVRYENLYLNCISYFYYFKQALCVQVQVIISVHFTFSFSRFSSCLQFDGCVQEREYFIGG